MMNKMDVKSAGRLVDFGISMCIPTCKQCFYDAGVITGGRDEAMADNQVIIGKNMSAFCVFTGEVA